MCGIMLTRLILATVSFVSMFAIVAMLLMLWRDMSGMAVAEDGEFAEAVFGGVVPYGVVLYSDDGSGAQRLEKGCQVIAVELDKSAPSDPPRIDNTRPETLRFGGAWQRTPLSAKFLTVSDPLTRCVDAIGPDFAGAIRAIKDADNAWYARGPGGQVVHLYAPAYRLAMRISVAKTR
jgi:hypothetical protein